MQIEMALSRILIAEAQDYQLVELKEVDGERRLPIVIGLFEAAAIERRLKNLPLRRPLTHDLLGNVIEALGGRLARIVISDLRHDTFYARLIIEREGELVEIDSRPSDAIALGVTHDVPIFVEEHVLDATA